MNSPSERTIKYAGVISSIFFFCAFYVMGEKSQTKSQQRILTRMGSSQNRYTQCSKELKALKGEMKLQVETEIQMAKEEGESVTTENDLLVEENDEIKETNYQLEDQIDQLREELNQQDFVADTEAEALTTLADLGNNTETIQKLLKAVNTNSDIKKGDLLSGLVDEIKLKRVASKQCRARLTTISTSLTEVTSKDHSELLDEVFGEWDDYLRYKGSHDGVALTKAIAEAAAKNSQKSKENKEKGIVEWDDFYDKDKDIADWEWDALTEGKGVGAAAGKREEDEELNWDNFN